MKINNPKKKSNKSNQTNPFKLSPNHKNKNKKEININLTSYKNFDLNNNFISPKKSKGEYVLIKKNKIPNTVYHRKMRSSSQSYIQFDNLLNDSDNNLNNSNQKISYLLRRNVFKKKNENINYIRNGNSRNKIELFKKKLNNNKKSCNLLSISFSLNDINELKKEKQKQKESYYNKSNYKKNKSLVILDNLYNREDTRNTTSITGINNSNLLKKKQILIKDNDYEKSAKIIKIDKKSGKKLLYSKNNSSKSITFVNNNNKNKENNNLYLYIYNHNIINVKSNKGIKSNNNNNPKNSITARKEYKNSIHKTQSAKKISFVNAISENLKMHYKNKTNKYEFKDAFNYNINSLKNTNKEAYVKVNRRKNKSQDTKSTIGIEYNNQMINFKSIEEIHFTFVQMNQKKKAFLQNE